MKQYTIPNLVKAMDILRLLSLHPQGLTAGALERQASVPRTTAFRILKTLVFVGMVQKRGGHYVSGPALVEIGLNTLQQFEIRQLAVPVLQELTAETGYTSHLAIPSGRHSLIVEVCDSPHPVRVASRPGASVSMHCSSTGKIFLAYLHAHHLAEQLGRTPLSPRTANTLVNLTDIEQMIREVRQKGYAVDDREFNDDIRCLAAPVFNLDHHVIAALGVTAPITHFQKTKIPVVSQQVINAARKLSVMLGAPSS